jgi:SHS2 domain-containing protein
MDKKFEEIDHGGDVGIEAWGETTERALENVTLGLFALMTHGGVSARVKRELAVEAGSDEDLLVDWLSEVIAAASTHGEVYCKAEIRSSGPHSVLGVLRGESIDPARHEFRFDVKAATYHQLVFERGKSGCRVRVVFDL